MKKNGKKLSVAQGFNFSIVNLVLVLAVGFSLTACSSAPSTNDKNASADRDCGANSTNKTTDVDCRSPASERGWFGRY